MSQAPTAGPQQCVAFNALADQHSEKAQSLLKSIETETQNLPVEEIARIMQERSAAAGSESQLADLAREAYKKCLTDYLAGSAPQPAAAPMQQAVPQQAAPPVQQAAPVQQAPVQQAPVQKKPPVQQARPVQQQQQQRVYRQQPQQQQQQQQPGIVFNPGGLIDLGIGIGIGRSHRDR